MHILTVSFSNRMFGYYMTSMFFIAPFKIIIYLYIFSTNLEENPKFGPIIICIFQFFMNTDGFSLLTFKHYYKTICYLPFKFSIDV